MQSHLEVASSEYGISKIVSAHWKKQLRADIIYRDIFILVEQRINSEV